MKPKTISHSKYKNPSVLFELLVRQITADTLAGAKVSPALDIMKKYFNVNTELGKEVQLYRAFFDGKPLTETKAIHFIDLILEQRGKLDDRKLAREKYDLIREVKQHYELKSFLAYKIPDYTVHASIYKTFLNHVNSDKSQIVNIADVATAKFTLVEHLIGRNQKKTVGKASHENELLQELKQEPEDIRLLAYKYLIDKFNSKYANLSEKQKDLLREYIYNVPSSNSLVTYIHTEIPRLKNELTFKGKTIKDKVLQIKLNEVATQLDKIQAKRDIRDNEVTALMIVYEILKEVEL